MSKARWSIQSFGPAGAPTIVLLHSIASSGEMWMPQVGVWAARWRCLLVDLPGHGATPSDPDLTSLDDYARALMGSLDVPRFSIVGLSLGGMIAQGCALNHGDRVERLVIANSLARVSPVARDLWETRLKAAQADGMAAQADDTLARWFTPSFRTASPLTMNWIRSLIAATQLDGYRGAVRAIQQLDYLERLKQIHCPALIITGNEDMIATRAVAGAMTAQIPGAVQKVIEGASHLSNVERPVQFAEAVGAFLALRG